MAMTPNTFNWNELATNDTEACSKFYTELFGWKAEPMGHYTIFTNGDQRVAGMLGMGPEWGTVKPHWMSYVGVADVDATAKRITELGGKVCVPPNDIPSVGRFAVVEDPTGAYFSIITWKMEAQ